MSEFIITIGKLDYQPYEKVCIKQLINMGLIKKRLIGKPKGDNVKWLNCDRNIAELSILNNAAVNLFIEYVCSLEGIPIGDGSGNNSKFKHIPWFEQSIWLPVQFKNPIIPLTVENGFYSCLCSSQSLIQDLNDLKHLSTIQLGEVPESYHAMRTDRTQFYSNTNFSLNNDEEVIQWVWKGLYDAAFLAVQNNAPMYT